MATNLRLSPSTAAALKDAAKSAGRSQQDLLREAVEQYLGIGDALTDRDRLIASGRVLRGTPFTDVEPELRLPAGLTSLDLLDRTGER